MKNLILLLSIFTLSLIGSQGKAQVTAMTASTYTVTNTGTATLTSLVKGSQSVVTVEYVMTKVSGTIGGTATLQGSVNGIAYSNVPVKVIKGEVNSFTNTDITSNSYVWVVEPSPYQYYRVSVAGTGTMVGTISGAVLVR